MKAKLFKPLGMKHTGFPSYDRAGPDIALPYEALLDEHEVFQQVLAPKRTRLGLPSGDGAPSSFPSHRLRRPGAATGRGGTGQTFLSRLVTLVERVSAS